jgi:hypothetical protein
VGVTGNRPQAVPGPHSEALTEGRASNIGEVPEGSRSTERPGSYSKGAPEPRGRDTPENGLAEECLPLSERRKTACRAACLGISHPVGSHLASLA